ncbi:MAG: hypothetical protein M1812_005799 [Candelaria pacifica]|nr:MAG: hypothetical protein M1812_005799 [Candelaria pacifica]
MPRDARTLFLTQLANQASIDKERLRLSQQHLDAVTREAGAYWHDLAKNALLQYGRGLPPQSVEPRNMLRRVPAIPDRRVLHTPLATFSTSRASCVRTHSTWCVADDGGCGVGGIAKTRPASLQLGVRAPISLALTGTSFCSWIGVEGERSNTGNFVAILALGWSYILSAQLVEMQGQDGAELVYMDRTARGYSLDEADLGAATIRVNVGAVDEEAARWWAAVLAPGQGWQAIVSRTNSATYLSPWSVSVEKKQHFVLEWATNLPRSMSSDGSTPPSSMKALELLTEFCALHDLGSQLFAALTTTMTFPTLNHYGKVATLPLPTTSRAGRQSTSAKATMPNLVTLAEEIPYYMSMSCNHSVIISSLCGVFWEPDVPCNLVSPWLHAVLRELPSMNGIISSSGRYAEVVTIMCAFRRPRLAALCLGAALSGLTATVLDLVDSGTPPLDPNAYAWNGCRQSFMDVAGSGPYFRTDSTCQRIQRADVWRLLYLPPIVEDDLHYQSLPFSPWEPIGTTSLQHTVARVKVHQSCPRHQLDYQLWSWHFRDGSTIEGKGFQIDTTEDSPHSWVASMKMKPTLSPPVAPLALPLDQDASRAASRETFAWVTANGEGYPPNEPIYNDEWLRENAISESSSSPKDVGACDSNDHLSALSEALNAVNGDAMDPTNGIECMKSEASKIPIQNWIDELF